MNGNLLVIRVKVRKEENRRKGVKGGHLKKIWSYDWKIVKLFSWWDRVYPQCAFWGCYGCDVSLFPVVSQFPQSQQEPVFLYSLNYITLYKAFCETGFLRDLRRGFHLMLFRTEAVYTDACGEWSGEGKSLAFLILYSTFVCWDLPPGEFWISTGVKRGNLTDTSIKGNNNNKNPADI